MTFDEWWNGVQPGVLVFGGNSVQGNTLRYSCRAAWDAAKADERAGPTVWERLAATLDTPMTIVKRVPPRTVEELIEGLNTFGGVCYAEHAQMVREFFERWRAS